MLKVLNDFPNNVSDEEESILERLLEKYSTPIPDYNLFYPEYDRALNTFLKYCRELECCKHGYMKGSFRLHKQPAHGFRRMLYSAGLTEEFIEDFPTSIKKYLANPDLFMTQFDGKVVHMRALQEARYARDLDVCRIRWEYEPKRFKTPSSPSHGYPPDFWLPDYGLWVELKNISRLSKTVESNLNKMSEFHRLYPSERLIMVYEEDLEDLERAINEQKSIDPRNFGMSIDKQLLMWQTGGNPWPCWSA